MDENSIRAWIANSSEHIIGARIADVDACVQLCLTGEEPGDWCITIQNEQVVFTEGTAQKANVAITADSRVMLMILNGQLNGSQAFLQGKLKVRGDIPLSIRLLTMFRP